MRYLAYFLGLLAFFATAPLSSRAETEPPPPTTDLARAVNALGFAVYDHLAEDYGRNILISPYGIFSSLALISEGASDTTKEELRNRAGIDKLGISPQTAIKDINTRLLKQPGGWFSSVWEKVSRSSYQLSLVNGVWLPPTLTPEQKFVDMADSIFGAHVENTLSPDTINSYAATASVDKLNPMILRSDIMGKITAALTNGTYFLGFWEQGFVKSKTNPLPFNGFDKIFPNTPLMVADVYSGYFEDDKAQVLQMKYKDSTLAMMIILPKNQGKGSFIEYEEQLDQMDIEDYARKLKDSDVSVVLPRFSSTERTQLRDSLRNMGINLATTAGQGRFCGIISKCAIAFDNAMHTAKIEVDEAGPNSSGANMLFGDMSAGSNNIPSTFRADRPFLYLVRDTSTGMVVFMGRYTTPVPEKK